MIPYIKIVQQYELLAVFWLGKFVGLSQPGLKFLLWPFHTTQTIDMREDVIDIPRQTNITSDNAPIDIDFLVYLRVMQEEAEKSVLEVVDYRSAVVGIATTTLRAVIGEMPLDDVLSQRERINEELRQKLILALALAPPKSTLLGQRGQSPLDRVTWPPARKS